MTGRLKILYAAAVLSAALYPTQTFAVGYCTGTINRILVQNDGLLMVFPSWRNDWVALCSVSSVWNGISTQACNAWVAQATSLSLTLKTSVITFQSLANDAACATMPTYSAAPLANYIQIIGQQ